MSEETFPRGSRRWGFLALVLTAMSCGKTSGEARFRVPDTSFTIVVQRHSTHLFLAEHNRSLLLLENENPVARAEMFPDAGGYSRANLYQQAASRFLLRDAE